MESYLSSVVRDLIAKLRALFPDESWQVQKKGFSFVVSSDELELSLMFGPEQISSKPHIAVKYTPLARLTAFRSKSDKIPPLDSDMASDLILQLVEDF